MLGNGMVLRETISSDTLSYLQMAVNALNLAAKSASPAVEMQWVMDDIMAFRGRYEDAIFDETILSILRCGICVERISLFERLSINRRETEIELKKLLSRLHKTKLPVHHASQETLLERVLGDFDASFDTLYQCVESLFIV
jgi:hypothetical protein